MLAPSCVPRICEAEARGQVPTSSRMAWPHHETQASQGNIRRPSCAFMSRLSLLNTDSSSGILASAISPTPVSCGLPPCPGRPCVLKCLHKDARPVARHLRTQAHCPTHTTPPASVGRGPSHLPDGFSWFQVPLRRRRRWPATSCPLL